jgi:thymidylate synthase ThyX
VSEPRARVIADSISPQGFRVTSIEALMHRFVLAEANTHRVFSRNSASSRAIPFGKQVEKVLTDPAYPVVWASEKKGMSGGEEIEDTVTAKLLWDAARDAAVRNASELANLGVHKSIVNRLLEPHMWHTVIITSTAWDNFFKLRCDPAAQPEMRAVAEAMERALSASTPKQIDYGQWHLPYIVEEDIRAIEEYLLDTLGQGNYGRRHVTKTLVKISTARCAGTSYLIQSERRDVDKDVSLYERLCANGHASPLEHPCTPTAQNARWVEVPALGSDVTKKLLLPEYGNLLGWHQHRFDVDVLADYQAFA